jgi:hypothetical protein
MHVPLRRGQGEDLNFICGTSGQRLSLCMNKKVIARRYGQQIKGLKILMSPMKMQNNLHQMFNYVPDSSVGNQHLQLINIFLLF